MRLFVVFFGLALVFANSPLGTDPVSYNHPVEVHHSLQHPLDQSQVYWNFGGSTVATRKFIRLTPSTQDRKGWLWNEYPLESENWEVEFKTEIFSKPHFGGDGMGFWVLHSEMDPAFTHAPATLTGPVFGLRNDYNGFGVVFDVYDNDNRRDNPSIFVVANDGKPTTYNHDNDYVNDMITKAAPLDSFGSSRVHSSHRCIAELRNSGKVAKVLVKYLKKILHVYVDTQDGIGYKFCLAVQLDRTFKDFHVAFTAATGQVADNHDILEVSTRYLTTADRTNDASMPQMDTIGSSSYHSLYWGVLFFMGLGLTFLVIYEHYALQQAKVLEPIRIVEQVNQIVYPHVALHGVLLVLLLVSFHWIPILPNLALFGFRVYQFITKSVTLNSATLATINHQPRLWAMLAVYAFASIYFIIQLTA